ncbi:phage tail protein, partial [Desulfovibrio oxamicus]
MAIKTTDAAWRRSLRAASFRGVGFKVDASDRETGRRAVTHEFPGRDVPYTEDLGRKARSYAVEAYVLGPDYMPARDALLKACEDEGPGRLVTPWAGEVLVVCTGCRLRESKTDGGMATFSLTFSEAGEAASPSGSAKPGALASSRADSAMDSADDVLDRDLALDGQPEPVLRDALSAVRGMASAARGVRSVVADPEGFASHLDLIDGMSVADLANAVPSDLMRPLFADSGDISSSSHTARSGEMLSLAASTPTVTVPEGAGTMRTTSAMNAQVLADYQRRAATAEAARSAALSTPASRADAATLREG